MIQGSFQSPQLPLKVHLHVAVDWMEAMKQEKLEAGWTTPCYKQQQ